MLPLPPGPPKVGKNPLALLRYAQRVGSDILAFQRERFERYGDTYSSHLRGLDTIVTRDAELIYQALVQDGDSYQKPEKGIGVVSLRRLLGRGLLFANGDEWRAQRRRVQPAFDAEHLRAYADTMVAYTEDHIAQWPAGDCVDVSREMMRLTLRIVGKVLMGVDVRHSAGDVEAAMDAFRRSLSGITMVLPPWLPHPARRREEAALDAMRLMMDGYIAQQVAGRADDTQCLLGVLSRGLGGPDAMEQEQLRDEALTLFFAGHETTSHALSWSLYLIGQHPEVLAKLQGELDQVLGDRRATYDDVPSLTYTQQVLSEAMRLYPPAPTILREAKRETQLGPYRVPAGAHVLISLYHAQRHEAVFHNPHAFDPARFEPARVGSIPRGAYLPFGAGTRVCVGKRFAVMEATLVLATLCRSLELTSATAEPPAPDVAVTLAPKGGIAMRVSSRAGRG